MKSLRSLERDSVREREPCGSRQADKAKGGLRGRGVVCQTEGVGVSVAVGDVADE